MVDYAGELEAIGSSFSGMTVPSVDGLPPPASGFTGSKKVNLPFDIKSRKYMIGAPLVIVVLLIILRPGFIYETDRQGKPFICYKKVALYTIVFTTILTVVLYVYGHEYK